MKGIFLLIFFLVVQTVLAEETNITTANNETNVINETEERRLVSENSSVECNISLSIKINKIIFEPGEKVEFKHELTNNSYNITIEYGIESLEGEIVKPYKETNNLNTKQFTPSEKDPELVLIKSRITEGIPCENKGKIQTEQIMIIKKKREREPSLKEKKIPEKMQFGEVKYLELEIYTGNHTEQELKIILMKEKNITDLKIEVSKPYQEYRITLPLQLTDNCKNIFAEGTYTLSLSFATKVISKELQITNASKSLCPTVKESPQKKEKIKETYNNSFKTNTVEKNLKMETKPKLEQQVYESSTEKTKNLSPFIFGAGLIVLAVVLFKGELHGIHRKSNYRSRRFSRRPYPKSNGRSAYPYERKPVFAARKGIYQRRKKRKR